MVPMMDRFLFNFEDHVRKAFAFLVELGFSAVETTPTHVLYRKDGVEVDVYHGRQSYELGVGVSNGGIRYALSEIIRIGDSDVAKRYRNPAATTLESMVTGLDDISAMLKRYGQSALSGDPAFFSRLKDARDVWAESYALDILAEQLRPAADEAFRRQDYSVAADLYSRFRGRLTPAEEKKFELAQRRGDRGAESRADVDR